MDDVWPSKSCEGVWTGQFRSGTLGASEIHGNRQVWDRGDGRATRARSPCGPWQTAGARDPDGPKALPLYDGAR
jgi:hypothetical protein